MPENTPIRCGLSSHDDPHLVQGSPKFVTGERLINFVKKIRPEFRAEYEVCRACYNTTEISYKRKYESAVRKLKLKMKGQSNAALISDPSLSSHSNNSSQKRPRESDSIDRLVNKTPRCRSIVREERTPLAHLQRLPANKTAATNISNEDSSNASSKRTSTSTSTSATSVASVVAFAKPSQVQSTQSDTDQQMSSKDKQNQQDPQSSQSSLDTQPTTSADAARRLAKKNVNFAAVANVTQHVAAVSLVDDDDDVWSDDASPALLSGARLPHIQPILKRKAFVHANKDIMDIYLAGTTGG